MQINLYENSITTILKLSLLLLLASCTNHKQEAPNCPIGHFGLSWNEAAYGTLGMFEGELTPCEALDSGSVYEKEILFAIKKNGMGEIELYGKPLMLISLPPIIDKGTLFWEQSFFNDTFSIKINVQNKQLASEKDQYMSKYTYSSTMTVSIKDTLFNYKLIGICDSISINKLLKK
jgi:hypothetical protein